MLPLTDLKTATLYYQYVRFTRRHDWWRVINHVPCMKDCQWINRMMSLYDITESAPENTVPKYRRNGARYGQTACVGGCVDRWSSSIDASVLLQYLFYDLNMLLRKILFQFSLEVFENYKSLLSSKHFFLIIKNCLNFNNRKQYNH